MVIGTALGWSNPATVVVSIVLAFGFGYSFTITPVMRSGLNSRAAVPVALAADTVSIRVMEILDTVVVLAVPGAMDAGLTSFFFWRSLALSLSWRFRSMAQWSCTALLLRMSPGPPVGPRRERWPGSSGSVHLRPSSFRRVLMAMRRPPASLC